MSKFCMKCGAEVQDNFKVCPKCGNMIQAGPASTPQQPPMQQQQPPQQTGNNMQATQPYAGGYPGAATGGSNKKLLLAIVAIVAIIVVVLVVFFVFMGGGQDSRFVGEWEQSYSGFGSSSSITWNFKSNGDLEVMGMNLAKWSVKGDQLCLEISDSWSSMMPAGEETDGCVSYEFSDNGNTLTIQPLGSGTASVLTKK